MGVALERTGGGGRGGVVGWSNYNVQESRKGEETNFISYVLNSKMFHYTIYTCKSYIVLNIVLETEFLSNST